MLESEDGSETYFGSQVVNSTASTFSAQAFLSGTAIDELGRPDAWLGRYLSQLYVVDMFLHNIDRSVPNFILMPNRQLCAIDFASADLTAITTDRFPIASSSTVRIGRLLRTKHPFDLDSALEMKARIAALSAAVPAAILGQMPDDWLNKKQGDEICAAWSNQKVELRVDAIQAGLKDASLL